LPPPPPYSGDTLRDFVTSRRYSSYFIDNYLVPICSSIWSAPGEAILSADACTVLSFLRNHHMLQVTGRPEWLTVAGRSVAYTAAVAARLRAAGGEVRTGARVAAVTHASGKKGGASVTMADGSVESYDAVMVATHAPDALGLLGEGASGEEREVLGAFAYEESDIYLHRRVRFRFCDALADVRFSCLSRAYRPRALTRRWRHAAQGCVAHAARALRLVRLELPVRYGLRHRNEAHRTFFNSLFLLTWRVSACAGTGGSVCLTYWLNTLQNLGDVPFAADASQAPPPPVLVTLNPAAPPAHVVARWRAAHPVPSRAAAAAKRRMGALQGARGGGVFFSGAYAGCVFTLECCALESAADLTLFRALPRAGLVSMRMA
jgi:predicted NAD/FAD-binding protein